MIAYIIRRLLQAVPVIIVGSFVTFLLVSAAGDPLVNLKTHQPPLPPKIIDAEKHRLRLDQPLLEQYWHWITGILHGNWGPSVDHIDIGHQIWQRLFVTARLVVPAMVLALVIALVVGAISASKRYSIFDYTFTFIGFVLLSMPLFWVAILLKEQAINFNASIGHTVVFTVGDSSIPAPSGLWARIGDSIGHLILPTIVLAMTSFAAWSRYVRSSMIEVRQADYVRLARAKGASPSRVLVRHSLRTALIPLTTVVALDLAAIFSGAVVTETVFQWHGMGDFLVTAIRDQDRYAVMAWLLVVAVIVILFNLAADLLYARLDRRIRLG
jgi:peptide/nickel transport system permease protein